MHQKFLFHNSYVELILQALNDVLWQCVCCLNTYTRFSEFFVITVFSLCKSLQELSADLGGRPYSRMHLRGQRLHPDGKALSGDQTAQEGKL